jgi:lipopolysaccharide export system permease protein
MLKNKIYKYLFNEIFKNFITVLITFTTIAWTVRAVNFLDLMLDDGFSAAIYFKYSLLNITTIISRFIPLSFLLSLVISISRFERQQELLILWTTGLNKIKIANIFFLFSIFTLLLQIILSSIVNPYLLNKSRSLLKESKFSQISSMLKTNDFSDSFSGITFYIKNKVSDGTLENIFINDSNGNLNSLLGDVGTSKNTTIIAEKGFVTNGKIILYDGFIQKIDDKNIIKNINFDKTELSLNNFNTRTIIQPKIQETSSYYLFKCMVNKDINKKFQNCSFQNNKKDVTETLLRRVVAPFYVPLMSVIASFMLIYKKENKYNYLKKYIVFSSAFIILIIAEILLKYSGFSALNSFSYFLAPIILFIILYSILIKNILFEKKLNE